MKRSEINQYINDAQKFFASFQFQLPVWSTWGEGEFKNHRNNCQEIFERKLGWDLTDFASGDYLKRGLLLFTVRNGDPKCPSHSYCEKIMRVEENQETPYHYHAEKVEDIINRGGGILVLQLYSKAKGKKELGTEPIVVSIDGVTQTIQSGDFVELKPGQSIRLERTVFHRFFGKEGLGPVMVGEVSSVNDDEGDNHFLEPMGRFPEIEEDEPIQTYMVGDYAKVV